MSKILAALALTVSLALVTPAWAYDPVAVRLTPTHVWSSTAGAIGMQHVLVPVPGPGTFDVDLSLPVGLTCPPKEVIKRKLPRFALPDHVSGEAKPITAITATVQSLGWHPEDGFTKLRITSWGEGETTYHLAVYYCLPSGHGSHN